MKTEVQTSIQELQRQFPQAAPVISTRDDGAGGAYADLNPHRDRFSLYPHEHVDGLPHTTLISVCGYLPGFHWIPEVRRTDGQAFVPPVTHGATFEGRAAIQISRRSSAAAQQGSQKAATKVLKILDFLEKVQ